ncbi:MAG TPA: ABC transporter substrate-binding protein [Ktedonobacteraceae bacterium]
METLDRYCEECGAANAREATQCFACSRPLETGQLERPGTEAREQPDEDDQSTRAQVYMQITLSADARTTVRLVQPQPQPQAVLPLLHERYRILSQVGTGGFGAVYKARDTRANGRIVAIKAIELNTLSAAQAIEATDTFNRELSLLSNLNHPHLPAIHEHFIDETHWYLVMDFIDGEPLDEYLQQTQQSSLPLQQVLPIGSQLCDVLRYLHQLQPPVIFRDLKPANIMRTPGGRLYLIDFGIARRFKPGQIRDTTPLGSPGFAAPEQYGKAQTTQRSDIYSLGATLYFLLTGYDPASTPFHLPAIRTLCPTLPEPLAELITSMLALDPAGRPATIGAVQQVLNNHSPSTRHTRVLAQSQVYAVPNNPAPQPAYRPAHRLRGFFRSILSVAITGAIIAACTLTAHFMGAASFSNSSSFAGSPPTPVAPAEFHVPYIGQLTSLNPFTTTDPQAADLENLLFGRLVSIDKDGQTAPGIASSWDYSRDGLQWTFYLPSNLTFSDGSPVTADDVAASLNHALASPSAPVACPFFSLVKDTNQLQTHRRSTLIGTSILVLDSQTIRIITAHPAPYLPSALVAPCGSILKQSDLSHVDSPLASDFTRLAFSSTYVVQRYENTLQMTTLILSYNHYNQYQEQSAQTPDRVIVLSYPDVDASYDRGYQTGLLSMSPAPVTASTSDPDFLNLYPLTLHYYAMNFLAKPFDNIAIRQAFALALDKTALITATSNPTSSLLASWQGPRSTAIELPPVTGNPLRAKQLLAQGLQQEGLNSSSQLPPVTFSYQAGQPLLATEITKAQLMWQHVLGIQVRLQPLQNLQRAITATRGNASLQFWAADYTQSTLDAYTTLALPFMAGSPWNTVNYGQNTSSSAQQQREIQNTLLLSSTASSPTDRVQYYQQAEAALLSDLAWLPIYRAAAPYFLSPGYPQPFSREWSPWGSEKYGAMAVGA